MVQLVPDIFDISVLVMGDTKNFKSITILITFIISNH